MKNKGHRDQPLVLDRYLQEHRDKIDCYLDIVIPSGDAYPKVIHEAMRYSVFAGGKRIRPILALATAHALGKPLEPVMSLAAALELIHTYSLIHDDLPALDNDDYRRGKPALHKEFGEGIAILAGNSLLNLAFQHLAEQKKASSPKNSLETIRLLSQAIGTFNGMLGGQVVDLLKQGNPYTSKELKYIHRSKTGALVHAAIYCAGTLCEAQKKELTKLSSFGSLVGLAFQIVDDILDVEGFSDEMGKETGKDKSNRKATYPDLFGLDKSKRIAGRLVEEAIQHIRLFGPRGKILKELAQFISVRRF